MQQEFSSIIEAHKAKIFKICLGFSVDADQAKDLFQDSCVNIWKSLDNFQGKSAIATWIYRITVNTCLLHKRKSKTQKEIFFADLPDKTGFVQHTEQPALEENLQLLYTFIRTLKESDKAIIMLYLEGLSYKEMEEVLGISVNNLGVRLNRIKKTLKTKFAQHG